MRDLGPKGITVNTVHPGPTDTDMNPADGPVAALVGPGIAVGRYGEPAEIASVVAFLAMMLLRPRRPSLQRNQRKQRQLLCTKRKILKRQNTDCCRAHPGATASAGVIEVEVTMGSSLGTRPREVP